MTKQDMILALGMLDDKYVAAAAPKIKKRKFHVKYAVAAAAAVVFVAALAAFATWLFLPFDYYDVSRYEGSEYYPIIEMLNANLRPENDPNRYTTRFNLLIKSVSRSINIKLHSQRYENSAGEEMPLLEVERYVEVTDNQVSGVIEDDLLKRSDKYAYYADYYYSLLNIYRLDGENSIGAVPSGSYDIRAALSNVNPFGNKSFRCAPMGLYLSDDCRTVCVILSCADSQIRSYTCLVVYDVSDIKNAKVKDVITVTGAYKSSRISDGNMLLFTEYYPSNNSKGLLGVDYSDVKTFIPQAGNGGEVSLLTPDKIIIPGHENRYSTAFNVTCLIDAKTFEIKDCLAVADSAHAIYVSNDRVCAVTNTFEYGEDNYRSKSVINVIGYSSDGLSYAGCTELDGYIESQYSLDERGKYLRAVTTENVRDTATNNVVSRNANLYCIDLDTMEVAASVIGFAPAGEHVNSVRFTENGAYVCTSKEETRIEGLEVIRYSLDPVFFFDLTDINNITCVDTGEIAGYSFSLVDFAKGYALGIGVDYENCLKFEIYAKNGDKVDSVCEYLTHAKNYTSSYKAYYIDRENSLIGFIADGDYRVLHFDGEDLNEVLAFDHKFHNFDIYPHEYVCVRGFCDDGYYYIFAPHELFMVKKLDIPPVDGEPSVVDSE